MLLLLLKIILAPLLVAAATLAQRRFGAAVGGRLVGMPLTATPMLLLLALAHGPHFASHVAIADQAGDVAASTWCVTYAVASRRWSPVRALAVASGAFAVVAVILGHVHIDLLEATVASSTFLIAALVWWPRPAAAVAADPVVSGPAPSTEGSDLAVRMVVAAGFTFAITESAAALGATAAGLLGAIPLVTVVLTVATHRREGAVAANGFLQGVMAGSFSVIGFLGVLGLTLPVIGLVPAFALALAAAVAAQVTGGRRVRVAGARVRRVVRPALRVPAPA